MNQTLNSELKLSSDWHRLGVNFSVRISFSKMQMNCEWEPHLPSRKEQLAVINLYRAARDNFLVDVSRKTGLSITCVEDFR